jgi:hypothetical protein
MSREHSLSENSTGELKKLMPGSPAEWVPERVGLSPIRKLCAYTVPNMKNPLFG